MGRGIMTRLIGSLEDAARKLPDNRKASNNRKYELADALKTGLAVFYFQNPSFLAFQNSMKQKHMRSNLETLFGVTEIPSANQVKTLLDGIEPEGLESVFDAGLKISKMEGVYAKYRVLDGEMPVACDGTWYFSSQEIHCSHCLWRTTKKKDGTEEKLYYHDMVAFAVVKHDSGVVLPLAPEFIRNEDGEEKQDCERNAFKRYIKRRSEQLRELKPIFLGDDLYCCHSICSDLDGRGFSFIFTCKDQSHPWIAEQTGEGAPFGEYKRTEWNGREHLEHRYRWLNRIENRADPQFMHVNYLEYEIWNVEKEKATYHNSWITNKTITAYNVVELTKVARSRWKIENEHNNVLKHRGYNLKHNFGHGENHACEIYCMLNLLCFLIHGLQDLADEEYKAARAAFSRRDEFFGSLRHETSFHLYTSWSELFNLLAGIEPGS
jgi:hypothetical protein